MCNFESDVTFWFGFKKRQNIVADKFVWFWVSLFAESTTRAGCVCHSMQGMKTSLLQAKVQCVETVSNICQLYSLCNKCEDESSTCITTVASRMNSLWRRQADLRRHSALEAESNWGECRMLPVNLLYISLMNDVSRNVCYRCADSFHILTALNIEIMVVWNVTPWSHIYRMPQEERSIFWEVTVSAILSEKSAYVHVSYSERFPR
jgi:hypothetical protein